MYDNIAVFEEGVNALILAAYSGKDKAIDAL